MDRLTVDADRRAAVITPKGDSPPIHSVEGTRLASAASLYSRPVAELLDYRERFPILADTTYLINHSLGGDAAAGGGPARGVRAHVEGARYPGLGRGLVGDAADGRRPDRPDHRRAARLDRHAPERRDRRGDRALVLPPVDPPRNRIVYEEGNFPSVRYLYQAQERRGADILVAADDEGVVEAIDERTLLVPVTHVLFKTGEIQDVEAIVRRAHEVGAHVVLDAYQSVGTVPLDVTALGVDFAVGGSVKWLCGGPGNGWLYVRPDLAETLEPTLVGWQAHARPFAFEPELEYAEGARASSPARRTCPRSTPRRPATT